MTKGTGPLRPEWDNAGYDPDVPTHDDPNSRFAASTVNIAARRQFICEAVEHNPGDFNCYDFCEGMLKKVGHGGVSGTISGLVTHGLLQRVGRKPNGRNKPEWTYDLHPNLVGHLPDIDWDLDLVEIAQKWDLDLTVPDETPPDEAIVAEPPRPMENRVFVCQGVKAKTLSKCGEPHTLPLGSLPEGGTTDEAMKWMRGRCYECGETTIWKGAKL